MAGALVRSPHPHPDAVLAPFALHVEGCKRADDPLLEAGDIGAHVRPAPLEIEHHVSDALARSMIGQLPAAPGGEQWKARLQEVGLLAAGAGGVERGMFQQPDQFRRAARGNGFRPRLHCGKSFRIGHRGVGNPPFYGGAGR